MHILEDHAIPWFRRYHTGAGLMGEQGAEAIHAHMHQLDTTHRGIPNELDRLQYIVREHGLETAPSLTSLRPAAKKRKVQSDSEEEDSDVDSESSDIES